MAGALVTLTFHCYSNEMTDPFDIRDSLAFTIARYARLQRRGFSELALAHGLDLSQEQWFILNRLRREGPRPQSELSDAIFADRPNLTRILQTMERKNFIARRHDHEDARKWIISLTRIGNAVHDQMAAAASAERKRLLGGIAPAEIATVHNVLLALEERLTATAAEQELPEDARSGKSDLNSLP